MCITFDYIYIYIYKNTTVVCKTDVKEEKKNHIEK